VFILVRQPARSLAHISDKADSYQLCLVVLISILNPSMIHLLPLDPFPYYRYHQNVNTCIYLFFGHMPTFRRLPEHVTNKSSQRRLSLACLPHFSAPISPKGPLTIPPNLTVHPLTGPIWLSMVVDHETRDERLANVVLVHNALPASFPASLHTGRR
jgi:hypothetical protein